MNTRAKLRLQLRVLWYDLVDRGRDLLNLAVPIFFTMGIVVGAAKFWWWAL